MGTPQPRMTTAGPQRVADLSSAGRGAGALTIHEMLSAVAGTKGGFKGASQTPVMKETLAQQSGCCEAGRTRVEEGCGRWVPDRG